MIPTTPIFRALLALHVLLVVVAPLLVLSDAGDVSQPAGLVRLGDALISLFPMLSWAGAAALILAGFGLYAGLHAAAIIGLAESKGWARGLFPFSFLLADALRLLPGGWVPAGTLEIMLLAASHMVFGAILTLVHFPWFEEHRFPSRRIGQWHAGTMTEQDIFRALRSQSPQ